MGKIRSNLAEALRKSRRDALIHALCTVIFTPIVAAVSLVTLALGIMMILPRRIYRYEFGPTFATSGNILMGFLFLCLIAAQHERGFSKRDAFWLVLAAIPLAVMLSLTYGTDLMTTKPAEFWVMYAAFALLTLALIGHAYEPRDDYYLGRGRYYDNPLTLRDDFDRGHVALGCLVSLPTLILQSYAEIFGSLWLFHGLDETEEATAAGVLFALGQGQTRNAENLLRGLGRKPAARVLRALDKLELLRMGKDGLGLSGEGEKFVGLSRYL